MAEETETATVSEPEAVSEPKAVPEPEAVPAAETPEASAPDIVETPPKRKRTVRTGRLFAGALVLGLVGGVVAGYTVQALRKPTPLPALRVTQPVYPVSPIYVGVQPPALPASSDDATIVNGDLTKLLLPTPSGATVDGIDHGWMELANEASTCDNPGGCFSTDVIDGVARIADTSWKRGDGNVVEIRIFQYVPGYSVWVDKAYTDYSTTSHTTLKLPAGIPAAGYEYKDSQGENDDHAVAVHGNLAVYFWVTSSAHVPDPSIISNVITQQMARL
jgi:hypothetical protein